MARLIIALSIFGSAILLTAFSGPSKSSLAPIKKDKFCTITCDWWPTTSNLNLASLSDCCSDDWQSPVTSSGFSASIGYTANMIEITTDVGLIHPAGTIRIYKNGDPTPVHTHTLTRNQPLICTEFFTATCGDAYTVTW